MKHGRIWAIDEPISFWGESRKKVADPGFYCYSSWVSITLRNVQKCKLRNRKLDMETIKCHKNCQRLQKVFTILRHSDIEVLCKNVMDTHFVLFH